MSKKYSKMKMRIRTGWQDTKNLINHFFDKTDRSYKLQSWPEVIFSCEEDTLRVELSKPIALMNWPFKASSSKKKCHILVDGHFTCRAGADDRIELLSYCTRIGYFDLESHSNPQSVTPIDGYHFDMETDIQRAHPVFHAQRHEKVLVDKLTEVNLELYNDPPASTLHHVHLPTPQIDLLSALILLIADHMVCDAETEEGFFQLARRAREFIPLKANLGNQAQLSQCIEQSELLLDHWYAPLTS